MSRPEPRRDYPWVDIGTLRQAYGSPRAKTQLYAPCRQCGAPVAGDGSGPHGCLWRKQASGRWRLVDCIGRVVDRRDVEAGNRPYWDRFPFVTQATPLGRRDHLVDAIPAEARVALAAIDIARQHGVKPYDARTCWGIARHGPLVGGATASPGAWELFSECACAASRLIEASAAEAAHDH